MLDRSLRVALAAALLVGVASSSTTVRPTAALASPLAADVAPRVDRSQPTGSGSDEPVEADPSATGRVVVQLQPGATEATAAEVAEVAGVELDGEVAALDAWLVDVGDADAAEVAAVLAADARVELAVPDHVRTVSRTPNDPYRAEQSHLATVRASGAWARTLATGTVVGVVDTGVDAQHPDLRGRVLRGYDFVDRDTDASDEEGHGTLVAGVAAAATDNGIGVAGVAWDARILPVRVLDDEGAGYDSDVAAGIRWAADRGAHVINLSLGGPEGSPLLDDAVAYATGQGSVVVAAAGNSGAEERSYPAASPGAVAVAATDAQGRLADFSTWGDWVTVAAPGFDVLSTLPTWTGWQYGWFDGTSAAAPVVAGVAALVRAQSPSMTPAQVTTRLRTTARDAGPRGIDPYYGAGVVDAAAAVGAAPAAAFPIAASDAHEPSDLPTQATPIVATSQGLTVRGATLAPEGDVDWYRYEVTTPTTLTVNVGYPELRQDDARSMFPLVTLHDENLRELARSGEDGTFRGHEQLTANVAPGTYLVEVRNAWGSTSNGPYSVWIEGSPAPSGRFGPAQQVTVTSSSTEATVFADLTGDGQPEALVTSWGWDTATGDDGVRILRREVTGVWRGGERHRVAGGTTAGPLAVADVDGDGIDDVLVGGRTGLHRFDVHDGDLVARGRLHDGDWTVWALTAADVDLDGDTDVVAATSSGVRLLRQADGVMVAELLLAGDAGSRWVDVEVGDLTGDATPEIVGVRANSGRPLQILTWDGAGYELTTATVNATTWALNAIAVGDVTGDGRDDVVATAGGNRPNSEIGVLPGGADGFGAPLVRAVWDIPSAVQLADVTGDGALDAVVLHHGFGRLSVLEQVQGRLGAPALTTVPSVPSNPHGLAVADVDGDGLPDLGVTSSGGGRFTTLRGASVDPMTVARAPAWVADASPAQHAVVSATSGFTVDLARPLDPTSVTASTVRLVDGRTGSTVAAVRSYDPVARRLAVTPSAPLRASRAYQLRLEGLRDADGRALPAPERRYVQVEKDGVAPAPVTGLTVDARQGQATLRWTKPADPDLDRIVVRRLAGVSAPTTSTGTEAYRGTGTSATATGLTGGTDHALAVWAYDESGNVSSRASVVVRATSLSASASASTVVHGSDVAVTGHLRRAGTTTGVGSRTVELLVRKQGATSWTRAATASTARDGAYRFVHRPAWHAEYRVRFPGAGDHLGAESSTRKVAVRTAVTAKLSATSVARNANVTLTGKVSPTHAGQRVTLQRQVDGTWRDVTTATLSSTSTYTFRPSTTRAGTYTYRVVKPADADHAVGTSLKVTLRVS